MCDSEKSTLLTQCDSQMEQELVKLRRCTEEKSTLNSKLNDLQWEIEKLKRQNKELESENDKLSQDVIELNAKTESFLKENEQLKVNYQDLKDHNEKTQQKLNAKQQNNDNNNNNNDNNDNSNSNSNNNNDNNDNNKDEDNNDGILSNSIEKMKEGLGFDSFLGHKEQEEEIPIPPEKIDDNSNNNNNEIIEKDHSDKLNQAPMIIDDHASNPLVKPKITMQIDASDKKNNNNYDNNDDENNNNSNNNNGNNKVIIINNDIDDGDGMDNGNKDNNNDDNYDNNNENPFLRNQVSIETAPVGIAVLIICYNRPAYLQRTLESVFSVIPPAEFPVFVSQQEYDDQVTKVIDSYTSQKKLYHIGFDYAKDTNQAKQPGFEGHQWLGYHKISAHYKYALSYLFDKLKYSKVIILEDDMELSDDFFNYFDNIGNLLKEDKSILCVSAWNDNGKSQFVYDSESLYRTEVFPGLGWMLTNELWNELSVKWPLSFWDDWLRNSEQRQGRSCIRPEINRVYTFGKKGSSQGQFFDQYLKDIQLNKNNIDFSKINLNYLLKENYGKYLYDIINEATQMTFENVMQLQQQPAPLDYVVKYENLDSFTRMSKKIGIMTDHKDGLPRTSYLGIVIIRYKQHRILFVPQSLDYNTLQNPN